MVKSKWLIVALAGAKNLYTWLLETSWGTSWTPSTIRDEKRESATMLCSLLGVALSARFGTEQVDVEVGAVYTRLPGKGR